MIFYEEELVGGIDTRVDLKTQSFSESEVMSSLTLFSSVWLSLANLQLLVTAGTKDVSSGDSERNIL